MAVRALRAHHHRDSKAGMLDDVFLHHIVSLCGKFQDNACLLILICPRIGTVETIQDAKTAHTFYLFFKFFRQCKFRTFSLIDPESVQTLIQLSYLFLQRHFAQQVFCPFLR